MIDPHLITSILTRTRDLVQQGYCKEWYAVDSNNQGVGILASEACAWCLEGAFYLAVFEHKAMLSYALLLKDLERYIPSPYQGEYLSVWSDLATTTQADVLALLERAMEGVNL